MSEIATIARDALGKAADANPAKPGGPLAGKKGVAAGLAIALAPLAAEGVAKLAGPKVADKASGLGGQAKDKVKETAKEAAGEAGEKLKPEMPKGLSGMTKLFGGSKDGDDGEDGGESSAAPGHGSGRRMPVQQAVDVAVPIRVAYDRWTQFEAWPEFMHRLESVDQTDDSTVAFSAKVWGITKRFEADIVEQRPDERIEWDVSQGLAHTGVVTFHELSDRLTRIELTIDVEPDSLIEKAARGMRFVKRAVRGDLHRFKAFVELSEEAEGAWRGTIADREVKRRTDGGSKRSGRGRSGGRSGSNQNGQARGSSSRGRTRSGSGSGSR